MAALEGRLITVLLAITLFVFFSIKHYQGYLVRGLYRKDDKEESWSETTQEEVAEGR